MDRRSFLKSTAIVTVASTAAIAKPELIKVTYVPSDDWTVSFFPAKGDKFRVPEKAFAMWYPGFDLSQLTEDKQWFQIDGRLHCVYKSRYGAPDLHMPEWGRTWVVNRLENGHYPSKLEMEDLWS